MIKYRKKIILFLLLFSFFYLTHSSLAYDFLTNSGLSETSNSAGYTNTLKNLTPQSMASKMITNILMLVGVIFLGLMIYGGIVWMTSRGNTTKVDAAKETIIDGITGLIIVLGAYALSFFIINFFVKNTLK